MALFQDFKNLGEAFKLFGKEKDEEIDKRSSIEKLEDFNEEKDIFSTTQSQESKDVESIDDTGVTETVKDVLGKEEKEKKVDKEDSLEKKLANIEKVIDKFSGGTTTLPSSKDLVGSSSDNINIRPLDMGQIQAKAIQEEYLKPSSVPNDRIALLYKDLEKYNLI